MTRDKLLPGSICHAPKEDPDIALRAFCNLFAFCMIDAMVKNYFNTYNNKNDLWNTILAERSERLAGQEVFLGLSPAPQMLKNTY